MRCIVVFGLLTVSACATGPDNRDRPFRDIPRIASPSAIVAAEIGFAQLAQEKGQWTAFRETAADGARMLVPELVDAKVWLKGRENPAKAVTWQPHKIFMSCDGNLAASTGAWQDAAGKSGYFTTIWQRQLDKSGSATQYKWLFDHGTPLEKPLAAPDFVETRVAACKPPAPGGQPDQAARNPAPSSDQSADRSFKWNVISASDNSAVLQVSLWNGKEYEQLIADKLAPPAAP